jgi:3-oxoacyl-[acyl-carrier protein] reductase
MIDEPRRVLITGARRGIGAAFARGLAGPGISLVLHHLAEAVDSDPAEIAAVAEDCRASGAAVEVLSADLGVPGAVAGLARSAGAVDVLVNNAARASNVDIESLSVVELQQTLAVNLVAPTVLAHELVPGMRERGWGRIVNVTSATLRMGGPSGPAYVASKGGLVGLTRALARSLGPTGITVNAISPGAVRTENEAELNADRSPSEVDAEVFRRQALDRRLVADDMVGCLRFLVSDSSAAVTGQVIEVGGGIVYR